MSLSNVIPFSDESLEDLLRRAEVAFADRSAASPCLTESCPRPVFYTEQEARALGLARIYYCTECLYRRRYIIAEIERLTAMLMRADEGLTIILGQSPDQLLHSPEIATVQLEAHISQLEGRLDRRREEPPRFESVVNEQTALNVEMMSQTQRLMLQQLESARQNAMRPPPRRGLLGSVQRELWDNVTGDTPSIMLQEMLDRVREEHESIAVREMNNRFEMNNRLANEAEHVNSYETPPRGRRLSHVTYDGIDDSPPVLMSPAQRDAYEGLANNVYYLNGDGAGGADAVGVVTGLPAHNIKQPEPVQPKLYKPKRKYATTYGEKWLYWQLYHTLQNPCVPSAGTIGDDALCGSVEITANDFPISVKADSCGDVYAAETFTIEVYGSFTGRQADFFRELTSMLETGFCFKAGKASWSRLVDEIHCRLVGLTVKKAVIFSGGGSNTCGFTATASFEVPEGTYLFTDEQVYWLFKRQKAFPKREKSVRRLDLSIYLGKNG